MAPTAEQVKAVERLVHESVGRVDALAPEAMRALLPALRDARDELRKDLASWLENAPDATERFTGYQRTQALRSLEASLERIEQLEPAMAQALGIGRRGTGPLAVENLDNEIRRLSSIFGGGVPTLPNIDAAAIIAKGDRLLWKRHANSAKRYAIGVGDDIRHQLAVAVAKGETFGQTVQRLAGSGSFRKAVALSDPGAAVAMMSDGMFHKWRHWADRLVRTENMHAYNTQHDLSIAHVNANRDEDEDEYLRRWDASADAITCPQCKDLHETTTTIDGTFKGGIKSPPLHPYCRCVVLAWLARWGNMKGETKARHREGGIMEPAANKPQQVPLTAADIPADGFTRRVRARDIADRGYSEPEAGLDPVKLEKARLAIATGQRDPVQLVVDKAGRIEVADGRHRLRAAVEADALVLVKFDRGKAVGRGKGMIKVDGGKPDLPQASKPPKNPKRVAAARKAAAASVERRREIYSAAKSNLPQELHTTWDQEGHKFMQQEAGRIRGIKDNVNASSTLSQAFAEKYGSGAETAFGNEGDRFFKRAEIEAKHGEKWADEQERKYRAAEHEAALRDGSINARGEVTARARAKPGRVDDWGDPVPDDDDPPF